VTNYSTNPDNNLGESSGDFQEHSAANTTGNIEAIDVHGRQQQGAEHEGDPANNELQSDAERIEQRDSGIQGEVDSRANLVVQQQHPGEQSIRHEVDPHAQRQQRPRVQGTRPETDSHATNQVRLDRVGTQVMGHSQEMETVFQVPIQILMKSLHNPVASGAHNT
jgi:hypothetical protein